MITIAFEFADTTRGQGVGGTAAPGLPDCWMDALIGDGHVEHRDYIAPGILRRIVARFPTQQHLDQFASTLRQVSKLLGTRALRGNVGSTSRIFYGTDR